MRLRGFLIQLFLLGTAICFAAETPNAAPAPSPAPPAEQAPSAEALIANLASEQYRVREEATRKLWEMGTEVLTPLKAAMQGDDPEIAFRASGLVRNIEHHITPETDPAMIELVERYFKANTEDKKDILTQIKMRRGWHQYLKLYETETDQGVRDDMIAEVHVISIVAAREKLAEGKAAEALKFLELAPRDNQSLMSIAAFHRAQGTLDEELTRAKAMPGADGALYRAALYRTAGNLDEARKAALEGNNENLAAELALHQGDPLPLLELIGKRKNDEPLQAAYLTAVTRKWRGEAALDSDIEQFSRMVSSKDEETRNAGMAALFLLGKHGPAEAALAKTSPLLAASHFQSVQRIPEALAAMGLEPLKPDYTGWAAKRFARIAGDEDGSSIATDELMHMAAMLTQLGLQSELVSAFEKPMLSLAEEDEDTFFAVLERLFSPSVNGGLAADLGREIGGRWAGADGGRWRTVVSLAFQDNEPIMDWWDWTAELDPKATPGERFDAMLAMLSYIRDPKRIGPKWIKLAWQAVEKAPEGQRTKFLKRISLMSTRDAANALKAWDKLPEDERGDSIQSPFQGLAASGRWLDATEVFKAIIKRDIKEGSGGGRIFLHAYVASSFRKAGKEKEAAEHDDVVEKLALGDWYTAYQNYLGYNYGGDTKRAAIWLERAVREAPIENLRDSGPQGDPLGEYADLLLEQGQWRESAALAEFAALRTLRQDAVDQSPEALLLHRLKVDLPYALAILEKDRAGSLRLLADCHGLFPGGGSLADFFYPSVRKAGLIKQHDEWFEASWKLFQDQIDTYPASDHLRNGAGWLAGRAARRLDEAEKDMTEALTLNPDQAAYLDTMAEVHFAKRDRKTAVKWSAQAVNYAPLNDNMIRHQYERFANDPFPEN